MKHTRSLQLSFVMALAAVLAAAPADAQGKGKGHGREKHRTEAVRRDRDRDRDDDDRYDRRERDDDRWDDNVRLQRRNGSVPPGWCRGKGNPHNTRENCGSSNSSRANRRYDDRYDRRSDTGRYGSYDEAHRAFHYDHDRICRERASQRPLDVRWQLQVRSECRAEHERWHSQYDQRRY